MAEEASGPEPPMDSSKRSALLTRGDVIEHVERHDRVEGPEGKLDVRQVGMPERPVRDVGPSYRELRAREINADVPRASGESGGIHSWSTAKLQHVGVCGQPGQDFSDILGPHVVRWLAFGPTPAVFADPIVAGLNDPLGIHIWIFAEDQLDVAAAPATANSRFSRQRA